MPVFDFSDKQDANAPAICTYETFASSENVATVEKPACS